MKKTTIRRVVLFGVPVLVTGAVFFALQYYNLLPQESYTAADFGIETVVSQRDYNQNGVDDYADLVLGARADAENHPAYNGKYYEGGYPPDNIGVCTDVIWRAFRQAGYSLRDMVDRDIAARPEAYTTIEEPDTNIDFRRVRNLHVFFREYAVSLTTDTTDIDQWQPGDIVIFGNDKHIGIISDKRNEDGQSYVIHNGGQPNREEDSIDRSTVTGHYRFDASRIDDATLCAWTDM